MKTLFAFCQRSGRRLRQYINRLITKLTANGEFRFALTLSLPLIAKVEISYTSKVEPADKKQDG